MTSFLQFSHHSIYHFQNLTSTKLYIVLISISSVTLGFFLLFIFLFLPRKYCSVIFLTSPILSQNEQKVDIAFPLSLIPDKLLVLLQAVIFTHPVVFHKQSKAESAPKLNKKQKSECQIIIGISQT